MTTKIQKGITKLFNAEGRLQKHLVQIVGQVNGRTAPYFIRILKAKIANPLDWDRFFKTLILLNNVIVNQQISLQQASVLLGMMNLKPMENSELHTMLINDLLVPYQFYLQKRCSIGNFTDKDLSEVNCYSLLNLLNIGASFSKMIFRLARYYATIVRYAEDFNIAWAADISEIYYWMARNLVLQKSSSFIHDFKIELQRVHESLYNIFYNCYYHKHLTKFTPIWIKTEQSNQNPESPKDKNSSNKSLKDTDCTKNKSSYSKELTPETIYSVEQELSVYVNQFKDYPQEQINQERQSQLRQFQQLTCQFQQLSLDVINRGKKCQSTL